MQERYNRIINHAIFVQEMDCIQKLEQQRIFCNHSMEHLVDVCRITYIMALENGEKLTKDLIYGAGLLHDLGRGAQYKTGVDHAEESARLARLILKDCDYSDEEIELIAEAILGHRGSKESGTQSVLGHLLYIADKKSRNCFACKASNECNWSEEKKNQGIF